VHRNAAMYILPMSLGSLARTILGQRWFPVVGGWYRGVFVDLERVVDCLPELPAGARILDIGGGDGQMINILLARHPEVAITMLDMSPRLGSFLKPEWKERVRLFPATSLRDYAKAEHEVPDLVIIGDVIHHVPEERRTEFFADLRTVLRGQATTLFVKDLEPGHFRSTLSVLADRYVSGDKRVSLASREAVTLLVREAFPGAEVRSTQLFEIDCPNYALLFSIKAAGA
jgi:cyclopropane fatty-acyl-phospholipid synthase-like methyltransferase